MANTPTLDEIEAGLDVVEPYLTHDYQRSLLALVAHVRALEKTTQLTDQAALDRITVMAERITALEAKVAALAGPVIPVDLSEIHAELDRLRAENAELRKRVEAGAWPAPQPIETAPLGRTVFWYSIAFKEWRCFAVTAEDMDEVRAGYSHWIPMPPPPGGGE